MIVIHARESYTSRWTLQFCQDVISPGTIAVLLKTMDRDLEVYRVTGDTVEKLYPQEES